MKTERVFVSNTWMSILIGIVSTIETLPWINITLDTRDS